MAVIGGTDYSSIAVDMANASLQMQSASQEVWDSVYTIVLLQLVIPEVDLLNYFYAAYQVVFQGTGTSLLIPPIRILQRHVVANSVYADPSAYIRNVVPGGQVPEEFSMLSAQAGYTLDADVIE